MNAITAVQASSLKAFAGHAIWFVLYSALFFFLAPVTPEQMENMGFWEVKTTHTVTGAGLGLVCALVFAALQKRVNGARREWLSWTLAIAIWLTINGGVAIATGRFG